MKKVLMIFGAGGSLGTGITEELKKNEFSQIYLIDVMDLDESGDNIKIIKASDLSKEENVEKVFSKISFDSDTHYFLYSTIGGFAGGNEVADMEFDEWNKMLNMNLNTSFLVAKHFVKSVRKTKGGSICFTSAMTSLSAEKNKASYGTSKSALNYLVKTLAKECKNHSISINAIAPLALDTPENREWVKDDTMMINTNEIGKLVSSIFEHWRILSGNIIELPGTLK